jgi:aminoglycoside phosphotransferase (APT) family kinase protein
MTETVGELASPVTFTAAAVLELLRRVCESAGTDFAGAEVLQAPADSAIVLVPSVGLVARIGVDVGHRGRLEQELRAASWLSDQGLFTPAPAATAPCPQLTVAEGRVVTWWQYIPSREHASLHGLMATLRVLHSLPTAGLDTARFDPWSRVAGQIRAATGLSDADRARLAHRWDELRSLWTRSRWPSEPYVAIHGDAHTLNTLVHEGAVYLLDLEDMRLGPWQWDTLTPLVHLRARWISADDYRAAIEAYGADPRAEDEIELLVAIRLLRITCWLASRTGREPAVIPRATRRIDYVEDPSLLIRRPSGF